MRDVAILVICVVISLHAFVSAIEKTSSKVEEIKIKKVVVNSLDRGLPVFKEVADSTGTNYAFLVVYSYMESGIDPTMKYRGRYGLTGTDIRLNDPKINLEYFIKSNDYFKEGYYEFLKKRKTVKYIEEFSMYYKFMTGEEIDGI